MGFCWKNQQRFCPKRGSRSFVKLNDGRRRCKQCGYIYHDFSRRWINLPWATKYLSRSFLDCKAETLLGLTVKKVRRGSIVYTDKYKTYDWLMFCGFRHLAVDHGKYFSSGKVYINGLEGFWSFAKERLIKHHGVSRKFFPLYLKELEFRYNYRQQNLFNKICQFLCDFVPDVE